MLTRPKNRYVLIEASEPIDTGNKDTAYEIIKALTAELGAIGYVEAMPKIVYQVGDRSFIIRTNRGREGAVILAFSFIKNISGRKIGFYTLKTSGTIRSLT
jgi:RNase P/RNase MRP subunit POP5